MLAQRRPLATSFALLGFAATLAHTGVALAQRTVAPAIDRRLQPTPSGPTKPGEKPSAWRGSTFTWNNAATTETLGVGSNVQSENPTYEMSFALSPRYYFWQDPGKLPRSIAVGARIEAVREFTNSDSTTDRGEWLLSNLLLTPQYTHGLYAENGYETTLAFRAPALAFPTSKASRNNGTIFGLGARLIGVQDFPLFRDSALLPSFGLTGVMGYDHVFRRTTTPTNGDFERERIGLDGETLPSDQLGYHAFIDDEVTLGFSTTLEIHERVRWSNLFEWHLGWRYKFQDDAELTIPTGQAPVEGQENPDNFGVVALFATELAFTVVEECSIEVGYQNLAPQIGPDAQRRSMFYSPDARFSLSVVANLDAIYDELAGNRKASLAGTEGAARGHY